MATDLPSAEFLRVRVHLSAELSDGRRIATSGADMGLTGPRQGIAAIWHRYHGPPLSEDADEQMDFLEQNYRVGRHDIEDGINQMLGRDPELYRPPRLAWANLISALAEHGIHLTEQYLMATPLTVELNPEVQAELDRPFGVIAQPGAG